MTCFVILNESLFPAEKHFLYMIKNERNHDKTKEIFQKSISNFPLKVVKKVYEPNIHLAMQNYLTLGVFNSTQPANRRLKMTMLKQERNFG